MSLNINFLSSPFQPELISSNKDKRSSFGSLKNQTPIKFASSNTHFLFLNDSNQLYGFGSNLKHQISTKKLPLFSLPIKIDLIDEDLLIKEIACGQDFSAINTNNQKIEIYGCQNCKIQKSNIRGLSASNNTLAFAYENNNVYIGTIKTNSNSSNDKNEINNSVYKLPSPILKTATNDYSVAALDQNGNVYIHDHNSDSFTQIPNILGSTISGSHDSITILNDNIIYVYKSQSKKLTSHYLPTNFKCVYACCSFSDIFALSEDGRVSHCIISENELSTYSYQYRSIKKCQISALKSICSISMDGNSAIFIKGDPSQFNYEMLPKNSPIQSGTRIKTANFDDTFICCTEKTAFFKSSIISYSNLMTLLSYKHVEGALYVTAAQEPLKMTDDQNALKKLNISIGDTVKLRPKTIEINGQHAKTGSDDEEEEDTENGSFEIVGVSEGQIWGRPLKSGYVVNLPGDVKKFNEMFEIADKTGAQFKSFIVNGHLTIVDVSSSSAEESGYSIGDLVWHPTHGIVEVVGTVCGSLVLLEFCGRTLFTHEAVEMEILRKSGDNVFDSKSEKSQKKSKKTRSSKLTRKVVDMNGEVILLDISFADEPRLFLPTDRVLSPIGEATVIGFNESPYIQTDEMRMNGYDAVKVDIFDLKLIRRINGVAERTVKVSKSSSDTKTVKVSLSTEDTVNGLLPGDKLQICDRYATVVGFTCEGQIGDVVIKFKGEKKCSFLEQPFTIIYRADINANRKSPSAPPAFVGSPMIQESAFLPGDVLYNKKIGEVVYIGYINDHVVFLVSKTDEFITFGFSLLLLPNFFEVIRRPVLDFWN